MYQDSVDDTSLALRKLEQVALSSLVPESSTSVSIFILILILMVIQSNAWSQCRVTSHKVIFY